LMLAHFLILEEATKAIQNHCLATKLKLDFPMR